MLVCELGGNRKRDLLKVPRAVLNGANMKHNIRNRTFDIVPLAMVNQMIDTIINFVPVIAVYSEGQVIHVPKLFGIFLLRRIRPHGITNGFDEVGNVMRIVDLHGPVGFKLAGLHIHAIGNVVNVDKVLFGIQSLQIIPKAVGIEGHDSMVPEVDDEVVVVAFHGNSPSCASAHMNLLPPCGRYNQYSTDDIPCQTLSSNINQNTFFPSILRSFFTLSLLILLRLVTKRAQNRLWSVQYY